MYIFFRLRTTRRLHTGIRQKKKKKKEEIGSEKRKKRCTMLNGAFDKLIKDELCKKVRF